MNGAGVIAVCLLGVGTSPQDTVELEGGKKLEGRVVYEDDDVLVLRRGSRDREIELADVVAVDSVARKLDRFLAVAEAVGANDVEGNLALAAQASAVGLEAEARLFWWRVLELAPDHADANRRLGHVRRGSRWLVPDGGRRWPLDQLLERRADWGEAWELETTHYVLRTNLDLGTAVAAALELERFYRTFFSTFARPLRLYEVEEPMDVHVHADAASYPESGNEGGYFAPAENIARVDASRGLHVGTLIHEATHQLIHNTAERERTYSGSIPGWLDEGLAEYMEASIRGSVGETTVEVGAVNRAHFRAQAMAGKPYDLARVIQFDAGDFSASTRRSLKYAQAYSLVHYCLRGEDGAYREGFLAFVRGAYRGKSSSTHFKKALGIRGEKGFDEGWSRYARSLGG